jgi:hypothetical protein
LYHQHVLVIHRGLVGVNSITSNNRS